MDSSLFVTDNRQFGQGAGRQRETRFDLHTKTRTMISEEKLIALIDLIYEAALDNDLWPRVLRKIADAAGTVQAGMASADRNADIVTAIAPRCDPNLLTLWREYWAVRDPFFSRAILRPAGEIY